MAGRITCGESYVALMNDNQLKYQSLEDNIYFTLRDIFWNGDHDDCINANHFNSLLTNDISYEDRDENFKYSNILHDQNSDFTLKLYRFLCNYKHKEYMFEFYELEEDEKDGLIIDKYMKYDDWWEQFHDLRILLSAHLKKSE